MDSVLTNNDETRPFFYYNFNRILELSDGGVSDVATEFCKDFLEKYPCEFLMYNKKEYHVYRQRWFEFIGFALYSLDNYKKFIRIADSKIKENCQKEFSSNWLDSKKEIKKNLEEQK